MVTITLYKWAGKKFFFKVKSHCEECDITESLLGDMKKKEFKGKNVTIEVKPWLNNIGYSLLRFGWHPPVVMVDGKKFHQYSKKHPIVDRKKLADFVLAKVKTHKKIDVQ